MVPKVPFSTKVAVSFLIQIYSNLQPQLNKLSSDLSQGVVKSIAGVEANTEVVLEYQMA